MLNQDAQTANANGVGSSDWLGRPDGVGLYWWRKCESNRWELAKVVESSSFVKCFHVEFLERSDRHTYINWTMEKLAENNHQWMKLSRPNDRTELPTPDTTVASKKNVQ